MPGRHPPEALGWAHEAAAVVIQEGLEGALGLRGLEDVGQVGVVDHRVHPDGSVAAAHVHPDRRGGTEHVVLVGEVPVGVDVGVKAIVPVLGVPLQDVDLLKPDPGLLPQMAAEVPHPAPCFAVVESHVVDRDERLRLDVVQGGRDLVGVVPHAVRAIVRLAGLAVKKDLTVLVIQGRSSRSTAEPPSGSWLLLLLVQDVFIGTEVWTADPAALVT
jgi:hypothetical protein